MLGSHTVREYFEAKSNWIDIISVLPFFAELFASVFSDKQNGILKLLRLARMLRIFRIAKLMRHNQNLRILIRHKPHINYKL